MATFKQHNGRGQNAGTDNKVASNSLVVENGDALSISAGFIVKATAGTTIVGVSMTNKTFASDNQTVASDVVIFDPVRPENTYDIPVAGGTSVVFSADLVSSNTINLKVNGVAMTQVTYATSNANTLGLIATQLETQFPTVIEDAYASGTRTVAITVKPGNTVTITDIVVAAGASQATGLQLDNADQGDVGDFYDITTAQYVDGMTNSATSGQLQLQKYISQAVGRFSIANT